MNHHHHSPALAFEAKHIHPALDRRRQAGSLRTLTPYFSSNTNAGTITTSHMSPTLMIDFSSNDYLGLAQSLQQQQKVECAYQKLPQHLLGSTGSRLLTGDSQYAHQLEHRLARWHKRPAAMLCNSGYDANVSVMSCLSLNSTVIMDELSHNSLQMGVRLGKGSRVRQFQHNDLDDLRRILIEEAAVNAEKPAIIVIESIYSMDGDAAPLKEILNTALVYNACVIVDEAHGLGVFGDKGLGMLEEHQLENHPSLLCSIHTFGKAAGCHGAVVCGSRAVKEFLYNYGRPIVYSTSLPLHSLVCISCAYDTMVSDLGRRLRSKVLDGVALFRKLVLENVIRKCKEDENLSLVASFSPIQALIIPGNQRCIEFCNRLKTKSKGAISLFPIRSPTVAKGQERVRVVLHAHNTKGQVQYLVGLIKLTLCDMGVLSTTGRDSCRDGICKELQSRL